MTMSYDGSDFAGWQRQLDRRSVQGELEKALRTMHGHDVSVTAAGRTDSGVHAIGQVVHFHTDIASIPAAKFRVALNKLMPVDVRVVEAAATRLDFHARFDARLRRYKYYIRACTPPLPHLDRYAWRLDHQPDLGRLNRLAACLRGELDCTAFSSARDEHENRHRYLHHATFYMEQDALVFDVAANAFLWHMVRSLVGTLVELDRAGAPDDAMQAILRSGERRQAGVTAPPHGLFLWQVEYYRAASHARPGSVAAGGGLTVPGGDLLVGQASGLPAGDEVPGPRLIPGLGYVDS
ncbi:MAG: tRNA pseudouridine(38-40) synthase TruA [Spirochaetes bacterium GWF1_60_12]|nr:MAG: tRNA pseudouridine(38-40) synthase TruA [Spirochaetes bacterium GWF1_60_12]